MPKDKKLVVVTPKFFDAATISFLEEQGYSVVLAMLPNGKPDAAATEEELVSVLSEADAWIVGHANVTLSLLQALPRLKVIARRGVGYERVDIDAAQRTGKVVTIAAGGNEESVADRTVGLMLATAHRFRESQQQLIDGPGSILVGNDLYGKTVGLVGLGRIAQHVVKRLRGFEATILVSTPRPTFAYGKAMNIEYVDLDALLQRSDFVSLHAPLKPCTKHLINAAGLARMKNSAFLINTARGGLVDDQALLESLKARRIAGAGLDVFESESERGLAWVTNELVRLPNVIATPHSGASTHEALQRTNRVAANCVAAVLGGEETPPGCLVASSTYSVS